MDKPSQHLDGWDAEDQADFWAMIAACADPISALLERARRFETVGALALSAYLHEHVIARYIDQERVSLNEQTYKLFVMQSATELTNLYHRLGRSAECDRAARTLFEIFHDEFADVSHRSSDLYLYAEMAIAHRCQRDAEHVLAIVEASQTMPRRPDDMKTAARLWDQLGNRELSNNRWNAAHAAQSDWEPFDRWRVSLSERRAESFQSAGALDGPTTMEELDDSSNTTPMELGQKVGDLLVAQGGSWCDEGFVLFRGPRIDPFCAAFEKIYFERPLVDWFERLIQ